MTKLYRYNLDASWDRNLNPDLKVASIAAGYGRDSGQPAHFAVRLFFFNEGHAHRWLTDNKLSSIGGKLTPLLANANGVKKLIVRFILDFSLSSKKEDCVINGSAYDRYNRLMKALDVDGYRIDWQKPDRIPRLYPSRKAFEEAINVSAI